MVNLRSMGRKAPLRTYLAALAVSGLIGAVAAGIVGFSLELGGIGIVAAAIVTAVAVALTVWICLLWWHGLDEAAREAHKWAWWWGGTAGTLIGGLGIMALSMVGSEDGRLPGGLASLSPTDGAMLAVVTVLLLQVGGYGIAWAVWWLARSRG